MKFPVLTMLILLLSATTAWFLLRPDPASPANPQPPRKTPAAGDSAAPAPAQEPWEIVLGIKVLKDRLARLEAKMAAQEYRAVGAAAGTSVIQLPSGVDGIEMSGFVDTSYTYNFNEPKDRVNDVRVFDTQANSFIINNAQLNIQKGVDYASPLGFKIALMFGDDAESTHSTGLFGGAGSDQSMDIQQAYVEYLAPVGEGLDVTFGKQATLIGAEVIESIDNWNFSRSILFGKAIPFIHTGVRASYPLTPEVSATFGVNNGWDNADDDNIGKGIEGQLAWESDPFFVSLTGMFSPEVGATGINKDRWVADVVASYQATPKLALMLNYDFGYQENGTATDATDWQGVAAYAKYDVNDRWSLAGRYEIFHDEAGFRTGLGVGDVFFQEFTLTSQHQIHNNLIARLEYRHDQADAAVFDQDKGGGENYQDTVAVEFIMPF